MAYAKINGVSLVKYPYTKSDLRQENPYSRYDSRYTLPEWYAMTDEGLTSGNQVVEVKTAEQPEYDATTHDITQKPVPELVDGEWVLGWDIVERPPVIEEE